MKVIYFALKVDHVVAEVLVFLKRKNYEFDLI